MGLLDLVAAPRQRVAYLFPELSTTGSAQLGVGLNGASSVTDLFIFQFWPSQVTDSYTPNYSTKQIPGASHPIYQYVGGSGRNIAFTANFVSEIREDKETPNKPFNERITDSFATGTTSPKPAFGAAFLPSARYTVNVSAAIAALQQYLYPSYNDNTATKGITKPPKKLVLVLPGTKLGRGDGNDGVLCILKGANVTMESWFPSGQLRAASVSLQFAEIVQFTTGSSTKIKYIGAESYEILAKQYVSDVTSSPADLSF